MKEIADLAVPGVKKLSPYQPGKPVAELERELGITNIIKLASNENPLGVPASAVAAIQKAAVDIALYPDGSAFDLKAALAKKLAVSAEQITIGNGSNELLDLIARVFLSPSENAVISRYAFVVYAIAVQSLGAELRVAEDKNFGHDLDAMAKLVDENTRMVFIANPNNPTGTCLGIAEIERFLKTIPKDVIVVLDEAYHEYVSRADYASGLTILDRYPNLIVTRTFSKAYGLAGLRVGYCVSSAVVADLLNRLREPFNANSLALASAEAVLQDDDYLQRSVDVNTKGMQQLEMGLKELNLPFIASSGNFIAVDFGRDTAPLYQAFFARRHYCATCRGVRHANLVANFYRAARTERKIFEWLPQGVVTMKSRRVLVVGLGLIGGSLALALKKRSACLEVLGVSRSASTIEKALAKGVIDRGSLDLTEQLQALSSGDVVVIATPTLSVKNIFEYLRAAVKQGVLVTDVASVKGSVVCDAEAVFGSLPENFIPGHPIAGSEKSGIDAVNAELFIRHQVILTPLPHSNSAAVAAITALWQAVGAELSLMSVDEHDSVLALTSHLPHMLAYTLVDTLAQRSQHRDIFRYAAGGFRDFTRIAGSDPVMWHDIALANRTALLNGLDDFEKHLLDLRSAIECGNGEYLHDLFARAKQARDAFGEMDAIRQMKKQSN